jgi:hypothetical protein
MQKGKQGSPRTSRCQCTTFSRRMSSWHNLPQNGKVCSHLLIALLLILLCRTFSLWWKDPKTPGSRLSSKKLSGAKYAAEIGHKRVSVPDLLERLPSVSLPFDAFLSLLPPMRVGLYSISSSPLRDPPRAILTYSLLSEPSLANPNLRHVGVASSCLSTLTAGDKLNVSVRPSHHHAVRSRTAAAGAPADGARCEKGV